MRAATLAQGFFVAFWILTTPGFGDANLGADTGSTFDNVELVDPSLGTKVAILRVGSQPGENGLLSVFAGFRNKTARPLNLEVETIYKDDSGQPLNNASWIPITFKPHEEREYRSASISDRAVDFLVRVRASRG